MTYGRTDGLFRANPCVKTDVEALKLEFAEELDLGNKRTTNRDNTLCKLFAEFEKAVEKEKLSWVGVELPSSVAKDGPRMAVAKRGTPKADAKNLENFQTLQAHSYTLILARRALLRKEAALKAQSPGVLADFALDFEMDVDPSRFKQDGSEEEEELDEKSRAIFEQMQEASKKMAGKRKVASASPSASPAKRGKSKSLAPEDLGGPSNRGESSSPDE